MIVKHSTWRYSKKGLNDATPSCHTGAESLTVNVSRQRQKNNNLAGNLWVPGGVGLRGGGREARQGGKMAEKPHDRKEEMEDTLLPLLTPVGLDVGGEREGGTRTQWFHGYLKGLILYLSISAVMETRGVEKGIGGVLGSVQ